MNESGGEIAKAKSSKSEKTSTVRLKNPTLLDIRSGEAEIHSVSATIVKNKKERDAGSFILRFAEGIKDYLSHYKYLLENGFPVPTTVRTIEGRDELLITDLRHRGAEVFSLNEILTEKIDPIGKIANITQVKSELDKIAERGDGLSMLIAADAYFIVLDPKTHQAKVILGDLGAGIYTPDEFEKYKTYKWADVGRTCKSEVEQLYVALTQGLDGYLALPV